MLYMNESDIKSIGFQWNEIVQVIENAVHCLAENDYAQPIKPYLRYGEPQNRIIAMPAYVGGEINQAGIKWIASFPKNIEKNIPRAHSVVILNDAATGEPHAIINTALLSILRTAGVTGSIIKAYSKGRELDRLKVGIIGWGPIGQHHFKMVTELLKDKIDSIALYDLRPINKDEIEYEHKDHIHVCASWEEAYKDADIFITCTVSKEAYIDQEPKKGSLQLNVSLRDYKTDIFEYVQNGIIVDDWEEVCRENTGIEMMALEKGLKKEATQSIVDVICKNGMQKFDKDQVIMFNPMGMAIFDIAVGSYYYDKAKSLQVGTKL
ncbi:2,3-diaminopropionate biosynthesis protein SbnB [Brevibacillus laterosporus]|uniref:2,3-diaminopropionate biosynthesis protein SbnB n=1 Tax=Brevibacillus laterosporus TaxID=1465 RepID=A0A518V5G9_BRELA|nr:2,3-diaminopropionate biosynthesis protein SbnB [Brevibacillus laterosporus]